MFAIRIEGLNETIRYIEDVPSRTASGALIKGMATIAYEGLLHGAGRHSPRPGGTGKLRASTYQRGDAKRQEVGHDPQQAPYAGFVILGTPAHAIRPKNAKALRWFAWPGGPAVFAKSVWHPGYRGDDYFNPAVDNAIAQMRRLMDEAFA